MRTNTIMLQEKNEVSKYTVLEIILKSKFGTEKTALFYKNRNCICILGNFTHSNGWVRSGADGWELANYMNPQRGNGVCFEWVHQGIEE